MTTPLQEIKELRRYLLAILAQYQSVTDGQTNKQTTELIAPCVGEWMSSRDNTKNVARSVNSPTAAK